MENNTKDGYVHWFGEYDWNWACTLGIRFGIRRKSADRLWRKWITQLEEIERHRVSWARMLEVGEDSGRYHFHGVVGGVHRTSRETAASLWLSNDGAFDARLKKFYSDGWIEYSLKEMESTDDYDLDFELLEEHRHSKRLLTTLSRSEAEK